MNIIGFLGSPRVNGRSAKLLNKALEGAESRGAKTKRVDLIKHNINFCLGCFKCYKSPEKPIGDCVLNDDMTDILEEYVRADAYIYASPAYDMFVTALMKVFLERKIALTYKPDGHAGKFPIPRPGIATNFNKKASIIIVGNSADTYEEVMGVPCYEAVEADLACEQIDTLDKLYVGGVESITEQTFLEKMERAYQIGEHLTGEMEKIKNASFI